MYSHRQRRKFSVPAHSGELPSGFGRKSTPPQQTSRQPGTQQTTLLDRTRWDASRADARDDGASEQRDYGQRVRNDWPTRVVGRASRRRAGAGHEHERQDHTVVAIEIRYVERGRVLKSAGSHARQHFTVVRTGVWRAWDDVARRWIESMMRR